MSSINNINKNVLPNVLPNVSFLSIVHSNEDRFVTYIGDTSVTLSISIVSRSLLYAHFKFQLLYAICILLKYAHNFAV